MSEGYTRTSIANLEPNPEKPGTRWELSPALGVDAFNFNVGVIEPGERFSQTHFHYHEGQVELFYVACGRCRVEVADGGFDVETGDAVVFEAGERGVHVLYNPFDEPCRLVAVGWPPEGRRPVHQVATTEELLAERYGDDAET